jgi:hypothetical protein
MDFLDLIHLNPFPKKEENHPPRGARAGPANHAVSLASHRAVLGVSRVSIRSRSTWKRINRKRACRLSARWAVPRNFQDSMTAFAMRFRNMGKSVIGYAMSVDDSFLQKRLLGTTNVQSHRVECVGYRKYIIRRGRMYCTNKWINNTVLIFIPVI